MFNPLRVAAAVPLVTCLLLAAPGASAQAPGKRELRLPVTSPQDLLPIPESIDVDERTRSYFTAATIGGTVYRGSLDEPEAEVFLPAGADGRLAGQGVEIDDERRLLFIATAQQGTVDVYDIDTKALVGQYSTGLGGYINDVTVTPRGDVYFTDSLRPILFRVAAADVRTRVTPPQIAIPQTGPFTYSVTSNGNVEPNAVFNAGGIVALDDHRLIVTQINEGKLFRFTLNDDASTQMIDEVRIDGGELDNLDGFERRGSTLFVSDNLADEIATLELAPDAASVRITQRTSEPNFCSPTGIASVEGEERIVVVNAQLFRPTGTPFTISSLPLPLDGTTIDNPDRGMTLLPCQRDLGAAGPLPAGPESTAPAADPADARRREAAKLQVERAQVDGRRRRLDVLGTLTSRATGVRVPASFEAAGRTTQMSAVVTRPRGQELGRLRLTGTLPAPQAARGTGILTLAFAGTDAVRPSSVRLRAARNAARLGVTRPVIRGGRLSARGTVASPTGTVRLQLVFRAANRTHAFDVRAPIQGGAFRFDAQLPDSVRALLRGRQGAVQSYTTFTGNFAKRIRGEQQAFSIREIGA